MQKICLYNPSWHTLGGGEKYILSIAELLVRDPENDIHVLSADRSLTPERIRKAFNLHLDRASFSAVRTREARHALAAADVSVVVSNFRPFGIRARRNILVLQIPYGPITAASIARRCGRFAIREAAKDFFRLRLLGEARRADLVLVYSEFVRSVLERHHHIQARVLPPPIDDFKRTAEPHNAILSVGRIFRGRYNDKRYDALIEGFKRLYELLGDPSWEYRIVGNCGDDVNSQAYLSDLRRQATGYPIHFHVNTSYADLARHYNEASIFWHGAGFDVNEDREPERTEHFGMTTVEAMSAGCVPVVINKGGQKEIVQPGQSGFLWDTLGQLVELTVRLVRDEALVKRLRAAARVRFHDFDHDHFESRFGELMSRLSPIPGTLHVPPDV